MTEDNILITSAMEIILNAGDARNFIQQAVKAYVKKELTEMTHYFAQAEEAIRQAHVAQTQVVQSEAAGTQYEYSLLMTHAMDTLMTIISELHMTKNMILIDRKDGTN